MGPQLEYLETILTCKGNFYAPDFSSHLDDLKCRLQELVFSDDDKKLVVKKVEPWNSVRVTLKMPVDAARKLKKLAEQRDRLLHEIGVLEVQIEGDKVISLTVDGSKSENLEQLPENARKLQNLAETPSCCSGQCVPSRETLNPFASLPQSANVEWPLFTKILNSIGERSSTNVSLSVTDLQVGCSQTCQKYSNAIVTSSFPYENSINFAESSKFTQNASSSPFELSSTLGNRSWSAGEEKLINCQNIASSSPLLVNLLKSPGSRNQMNGTSFSAHANSELSSEMAVPTQKRRRSQTRKSKRLKEGCDDANLLGENSHQGIPRSFATFRQDAIGVSSPNVSCQMNVLEPRQMINPYTGDLEVIEECEEPSNSTSSDSITYLKDSNPCDSLSASVTNTILVKTLESRTTHASDLSGSEKFASSHSSKILSSSHNGSLAHSPTSDASSDILLRSTMETSTSAILNSKIPVYNLQSSIATSYQNINIPHSVGSSIPSSLPENSLLLNHTLSTCYLQNMLKALSSENAAKFFASQSLVLPSSSEHVQEETKSIIDANTLAKIIVQSSLLPKSFDSMKNVCPGEARPYSYPGSALLNSNAQLTKQLASNSKFSPFPVNVVPHDGKLPAYINVPLKEGASVQQMSKRLLETQTFQKLTKLNNVVSCTQASQLMKDMFPSLSLPVFSAGASIPITCATYNGHIDSSHQDEITNKTSHTDFLKNSSLYSSDCRAINGCYSSTLGQISFVNDTQKLTGAALLASSASATTSSDCDGSLTTFGPSKSLPCRKPSKNADDILPTKSKANLTVAQLLEQVEIAKNHLAYSASQKNVGSESPLAYTSSSGVVSTKSCNAKSEQKNETASHMHKSTLASQNNFGHPHKLSTCLNSLPFNVLDSTPMPITSPGYPHNLTESVQKAMRGIGFDNSPSASPLPSKQADATLHHQTNATKASHENKVSNHNSSASASKEDSVGLPDLDILENQFEFRQLEEALKCTLKNHEQGQQSNAASQKHLIDLDSTDLDFVFNAEDESHLESIIALRDYDDIEKLAETLASNIDGGDIDEILINEKDLESLDQGNNIYKASKSNCSQPLVNPDVCTSVDSDIIQIASSLLNSNTNQQSKEDITKPDFNTELSKTKLLVDSMSEAKVSEMIADHIHSEAFVERNQCKSPYNSKKVMDVASLEKNQEFIDETVSHSTSNRMATRSSNKQNSSVPNLHNDSIFQASTPVMSKDIQKNTSEEATLQPSLRRSNRTIRKTELAYESFPAKSIERSKKAKHEGDKLHPLPSVKSEVGAKVFRQKSTQKRKHSSRTCSINENIHSAAEVQKDQNSLKRVGNSSSSVTNDSAITEPDFLYNKRPKTS